MRSLMKSRYGTVFLIALVVGLLTASIPVVYAQPAEVPIANAVEIAAALGIAAGAIMRTVLPYVKKRAEAEEEKKAVPKFENRYGWTLGFALILGLATALGGMAAFAIPNNPTSLLAVIWLGFPYGWGLNSIFNSLAER